MFSMQIMEECVMIHSFLLIGQSNMAGRGFLADAHKIDTSRIYTLRNGRFQTMFRPICPDRIACGVNLAESFAESYAQKHDVDVGLICAADGGSNLDQWAPGSLIFDHAVAQAKLAARSSVIMGVLWHQGESDCKPEKNATYRRRCEEMIAGFREAVPELKGVPFLLGGLGDFLQNCAKYPELKDYPKVNAALKEMAQNDPLIGFVSAEGLKGNPDNLHFSSTSLYEFGLRYLAEFEKFQVRTTGGKSSEDNMERSSMELL